MSQTAVAFLLFGCGMAAGTACHAMDARPQVPSTAGHAPAVAGATTPIAAADPDEASATGAAAARSSRRPHRPRTERDYLGKWIGVEGLLLDVGRGTNGKLVVVNFWSLDEADRGSFDAEVVPQGLRWTRKGDTVVARPTDGTATGLKWLDGKKDCLTVVKGEGYCRD